MIKTPFLSATYGIFVKDLRTEFRSRELLSTMALFAVLSVLIFSFALELDRAVRAEAIGGVLWVTVAFAAILGLNRSLGAEREGGGFEAVLLTPIDRAAIFAGKLAGNFAFAFAVGLLLVPLMAVIYNLPVAQPWLLIVLALGTAGLAGIGTLLATMTAQARARDTLLPLVMLPLALPIVLAAVRATTSILAGLPFTDWIGWLALLAAIDVIYFAVCFLLFEFVVEE